MTRRSRIDGVLPQFPNNLRIGIAFVQHRLCRKPGKLAPRPQAGRHYFSGLSDREFDFLIERVASRKYYAGKIVFSEGEPCAGLFVVESGSVRIFKSSPGGREQGLSIEGRGGSVAELPVFAGGNYPASVVAVEDTVLLFVSRQDFQALCLARPAVALKVLKVVGGTVAAGWHHRGTLIYNRSPAVGRIPASHSTKRGQESRTRDRSYAARE